MWIVWLADNIHEMSNLIILVKWKKKLIILGMEEPDYLGQVK